MKRSNIYTKSGDRGMTSLAGGRRLPKSDMRIEAYGTVDELNSFVGLLIVELTDMQDCEFLLGVQNALFVVGACLAVDPASDYKHGLSLAAEDVALIETEIDRIDEELPAHRNFLLPGGCRTASLAHICRTVCRRAERHIYRLYETEPADEHLPAYINRLSDYFFVLARKECINARGSEIIWTKK
jgi:cob(I)alamin adenosyltransferase